MTIAETLLTALAAPVVGAAGYLTALSLLSARSRPPEAGEPLLRFAVVVPAHDEATGITATVESLLAIDYPRSLYRVIVVADNCSDDTAELARKAGAEVLERRDFLRQRGKGYALNHAFERLLAEHRTNAVVVVDADTLVSPNLLRAFAARLDAGASAIQADYLVRNSGASWRTRLMTIALATVHDLRSLARERLALSSGLKGNGMCFTTALLRAVPYDAFSIVEDLEYGIRLGELGYRVHYADEAHVYGEMPTGEDNSGTQRRRWEDGRARMRELHALRLVGRGLRRGDRVCLDLGIDLLIPPLATIASATAVGLGASTLLSLWNGHVPLAGWLWLGSAVGLGIYAFRGWQLSGTGVEGLRALVHVPPYVAWKLRLRFQGAARPDGEWVRTAREPESAP